MEKEPSERISFAVAKSLFEKDSVKPIPKSASASESLSGGLSSQRSLENGDKAENSGKDRPRLQSGAGDNYLEIGYGSTKTVGMKSSTSFDSSNEAPKTNFIIPKKRGDTSDLRWLTSVHNSIPLGIQAASAKPKPDTNHSVKGNAAVDGKHSDGLIASSSSSASLLPSSTGGKAAKSLSNSINNPASAQQLGSKDHSDSSLVKPQSSSTTKASSSEGPRSTKQPGVPVAPTVNWSTGKTKSNLETADQTQIVKSAMTITLNTGSSGQNQIKGADAGWRAEAPVNGSSASGFSAVLEEIRKRKITSIHEQSQNKATESCDVRDHAKTSFAPDLPKIPPPSQDALRMPEKMPRADNHEEDSHRPVRLKDWNPSKLVRELYQTTLQPEMNVHADYINMEGYLEKLPISKTKDTFLKTWKRRYFKALNGTLHYHESVNEKKESGNFKLDGGKVEEIGERILGIEDGRGHYLVLRCGSEKDYADWRRAFQSQTVEGVQSAWVKPVLRSLKPNAKKVIVLELGSCSIRAGILGETVALPDVFLPTIVATHRETGHRRFCFDALLPEARSNSTLSYPIRPTAKVDKYSIDWDSIPGIFDHVFHQLNVDPSKYSIMFSIPTSFSDKIKSQFMDILVNRFKVAAVNMVCQTILSLYSYSATSGVVVDIGDRIEILPLADGYVVEGGVTRVPYGGQMITDAFNRSFTDRRYRFFTDVEFQIVRLAMEKLCYVSSNYKSEMEQFNENPDGFSARLSLDSYELPTGSFEDISNDLGRFQSPEGLFDTFFWGLDNPPIHEMIQRAIQACPIDMRRQMWRSVYLSGGVTLLKGFPERLQKELSKLAPSAVAVQVHAAPNRYHSSYLGASALALMAAFDAGCVSSSEWLQSGASNLKKWKAY